MGNKRKKWMKWRATRGNQSKLRMHIKGKGRVPSAGYRTPKTLRARHPTGLKEVIVYNAHQLEWVAPVGKDYIVRIAAGVGKLKRKNIQDLAGKLKIKLANPKKVELRKKLTEQPQEKLLKE